MSEVLSQIFKSLASKIKPGEVSDASCLLCTVGGAMQLQKSCPLSNLKRSTSNKNSRFKNKFRFKTTFWSKSVVDCTKWFRLFIFDT